MGIFIGNDTLRYQTYEHNDFNYFLSDGKLRKNYFINLRIILVYTFFLSQNVIDGDLCEQFNSLDPTKQKNIASELDRTPAEVSKKLEDIRTRYAF